jgi:uncharacterized C2H2 Zn-finger protein
VFLIYHIKRETFNLYNCTRCLKTFNQISNYKRHTNRIRLCEEGLYKNYYQAPNKIVNQKEEITNAQISKNDENIKLLINIKKQCEYCKKFFCRSDILNRHMKHSCKVLKSQNNEKEKEKNDKYVSTNYRYAKYIKKK